MGKVSSETEAKVNKALYALLGLTVSGVVAFAIYIVNDVKDDVERCKVMLVSIHKQIANIEIGQSQRWEQIDALRKGIEKREEHSEVRGIVEELKVIYERSAVSSKRIERLEQEVIKIRGVKWTSPRGEWD